MQTMKKYWLILLLGICCAGCCPCSQKDGTSTSAPMEKKNNASVVDTNKTADPSTEEKMKNAPAPVSSVSLPDLVAKGLKVGKDKNGGIKSLDLTTVFPEGGGGFSSKDLVDLQGVRVVRGKGVLTSDLAVSLSKMPKLTELLWTDVVLEKNTLGPLVQLNGLKKIRLTGLNSPAPGEVLKTLAACPALVDLDLSGARISDSDIESLANAKKLEKLTLYNTPITDLGVQKLIPLAERILWLNLDATKITDQSGPDLAKLGNLTFLHLGRTECSDKILDSIGQLKALQKIHITRTKISEKGADSLRKSLPKTDVISKVEESASPAK